MWTTPGEETGRCVPVVMQGAPSGAYMRTAARGHQPGATMFRMCVRLKAWQFDVKTVLHYPICDPAGWSCAAGNGRAMRVVTIRVDDGAGSNVCYQ